MTHDPNPWKIEEEHIERCNIKSTITFSLTYFSETLCTWQKKHRALIIKTLSIQVSVVYAKTPVTSRSLVIMLV